MSIYHKKRLKILSRRFAFIKAENKKDINIKFKLPNLELLKNPTKKKEKILKKMKQMILNF